MKVVEIGFSSSLASHSHTNINAITYGLYIRMKFDLKKAQVGLNQMVHEKGSWKVFKTF